MRALGLRRRVLLGAPLALTGCSALSRPAYVEQVEWPLTLRRPVAVPPRAGGKVLVVRGLEPAPGLERRGVQWLRPDGSLHVDFYNQWAVSPAEGVTDDLRRWLAESGLFSAVVGSDAGVAGDFVLSGELTAFLGERGRARVALALVLVRTQPARVVLQRTFAGDAPFATAAAADVVRALLAALRVALGRTEAALGPVLRA